MLSDRTIFKSAFWSSLGILFERASFLVIPIFVAPLGPNALGIFYLAQRIFQSAINLPINILNTKFTHELRQLIQDTKSFSFAEEAVFLIKVYFLTGIFFSLIAIIPFLVISPIKSPMFLIFAIPFALTNYHLLLLLKLLQRFNKIFAIQIFGFLLQITFLIIFIKILHFGLDTVFAGQLLISMFLTVISFTYLFDRLNLIGFFRKLDLRIFKLSKLSLAHVLFNTIFPILDLIIVAIIFGTSLLGHYVVLLYLPLLLKIPTNLFNMFTHVASIKSHTLEETSSISKQVFKWMLIITCPSLIVILFFPDTLLSLLFHQAYVTDLLVTQLLAVAFFLQLFSWVAGRILLAKGKRTLLILSNYFSAALFIILAITLAANFQLLGVAIAYLSFAITDAVLKFILCSKKAKIIFINLAHFKISAAACFAASSAFVLFSNQPFLFLPFFLLLYLATLWSTKIIGKNTLLEYKRIVLGY